MPFIIIIIGVLLLVAAFNDSMGTLAHELENDIPGYFKWAIAIVAVLGLGFIPAMKTPSRYLIALIAVVIVAKNYQAAITGFTQFAGSAATPSGQGAASPTSAYVQSGGAGGTPTQAEIIGVASPDASGTPQPPPPTNWLNPNSYVGASAGFGGMV